MGAMQGMGDGSHESFEMVRLSEDELVRPQRGLHEIRIFKLCRR